MKQALLNGWTRARALAARAWGVVRRHPFFAAAALPVIAVVYVAALIPFTPSIADIRRAGTSQPTVVMSSDGQVLAEFKRVNREWVKLGDISTNVREALLATEDHRFYDHKGVDLRRTLSAILHTASGDVQGGSTITQQLARNLFPEEIGRRQTVNRKLKEAITAVKIESVYSKDEILETYLNTVPFLYNAYGIEMAAQTYFGKSAHELDVLESATLIGMLKGTSYYNPVINPERATARRNIVLAQLVGQGKLASTEFDKLKGEPLGLDFERKDDDLGAAPHVAQQLKRWLIAWADRKGYNIFADGLVVQTTIDSRLQKMATEAVARQADKLQLIADKAWTNRMGANKSLVQTFVRESAQYRAARESGLADADAIKKVQEDASFMEALWKDKTTLQAAFLAVEPATGEVRAWVGSRDFKQDQFDHVQQARRQPGSTFKPFVYGAAFEQGISPQQTFLDAPVEIRIDAHTVWKPGDVHESTNEPMTLRDGLIFSKNTITAQLMQQVGPARVAAVARAMGVRESKLDAVPSLALGTSPVTLKEMVTGYGTIANSGSYVEPVLVTRIENRKHEVLESFHAKAPEQGLQTAAAQTLLDVMRGVIDKGTGNGIRTRFGLQGDLAGKTGTTQDNTDGWFILMHPNLISGAWVGFNDNRITMGDSWGQGARNALLIVGDFFQQATKAKVVDTKAQFAAPKDTGAAERLNDWLNNVFNQQQPDEEQQPMVLVDPGNGGAPGTPGNPAYPINPNMAQPQQQQAAPAISIAPSGTFTARPRLDVQPYDVERARPAPVEVPPDEMRGGEPSYGVIRRMPAPPSLPGGPPDDTQ